MSMTATIPIAKAVEKYIALRDKVAEIKKRHADELNQYVLVMDQLEGIMLEKLNEDGVKSMATDAGTCFKTTRASTKVMDWSATLAFIKEKEAWDLLEARVSKTTVAAIMAETGQAVPGVVTSLETVVNVRRS